jgi:hypothetical protein
MGVGRMTIPLIEELGRLVRRAEPGSTHWHFNNCGCCVTLHGRDYAYVIGPDGQSTLYPERGCSCSVGARESNGGGSHADV